VRFSILLAALLACSSALGDEDAIRRSLEGKLGLKIEGIEPGPVPGLYEVRFRSPNGVQVVYVDASGSYVIQGKIYDVRTERDLTEERLRKLNAIKFESLPLDSAVKVQRGNGRRVLVRGEYGHDIIPELYPIAGEPVILGPQQIAETRAKIADYGQTKPSAKDE
jgi:hypothetical protein